MFEVDYDRCRETLNVRLWGFWSPATLACYSTELHAIVEQTLARRASFAVLNDATAFAAQSGEVADGFKKILDRAARINPGPTAIVTAGAISTMQAKRVANVPNVRFFDDVERANAWLHDVWDTDGMRASRVEGGPRDGAVMLP